MCANSREESIALVQHEVEEFTESVVGIADQMLEIGVHVADGTGIEVTHG